tara:strand:+ start:242 stop:502 length:261 start_codon:yes stop_codon:yes gene_type:complete
MRTYNQYISPLRQTAKQRRSSEIAEGKFAVKRCPLSITNKTNYLSKSSAFSQNIMLHRHMMNTASLNNVNNIQDYTSSMWEVKRAA